MTPRAVFQTSDAWLGKEFGEQLAIRHFGADVVAALPRHTKGKNVGKHKASIRWVKVVSGGWATDRVENRVGKIIGCQLVVMPFRGDVTVLHSLGETGRLL